MRIEHWRGGAAEFLLNNRTAHPATHRKRQPSRAETDKRTQVNLATTIALEQAHLPSPLSVDFPRRGQSFALMHCCAAPWRHRRQVPVTGTGI